MHRPRVLLYSNRNIVNKILARCLWLEFEDVIQQIDSVDFLAPHRSTSVNRFDLRYRFAANVAKHLPVALNPGVEKTQIHDEYELFFSMCAFPTDLLYLKTVNGWRERCRTAICWIDEVLLKHLANFRYVEGILSEFDHVFVSCGHVVETLRALTGRPCEFILPGVDAISFCPYPNPPDRQIDVLSIGRRPDDLHDRLIKATRNGKIFYVYDTISYFGSKYGLTAVDPSEHRLLFSNLLKRSKCFVTYPGKFDEPGVAESEEIIGARFFEGAAAGTLMVGRTPRHEAFGAHFPWPRSVFDLDDDTMDPVDLVAELVALPDAQCIRHAAISHALREHDWAHRWKTILDAAGLNPLPELVERQKALEGLANSVTEGGG